jgi:hypothetical protein
MSKPPIADGQMPAFFEDEPPPPEVPYLGTAVTRKDVKQRNGTKLDHKWTHAIEGQGRKGKRQHGLYDEKQRVYQTGGEISNFVYWKKRLVSMAKEAWDQIHLKVDWIEVIDHEKNECWRISGLKAHRYHQVYDAGLGPRVGIPMEKWDIITSRGTYRQEGEP